VRTHHPSRGDAGPKTSAVARPRVRAQSTHPVLAKEREGIRPSAQCAYDNEVCGPVRGGDSPVERQREPSLGPDRYAHASFFGSPACTARQPVSSRKGRTKAKAVKGRHLSLPHTRNWRARGKCPCIARIAEVGRTSSRPEKRATGHEKVESPIVNRSVVNGGSATSKLRARERRVSLLVKGRRLVGVRRSSSRERCAIDQGTSVRPYFGAGGLDGRLAMEGTSDRESARLSQGPRGTGLGGLRAEAGGRENAASRRERGGGDRGVRDGHCDRDRGKTTPSQSARSAVEVGVAL